MVNSLAWLWMAWLHAPLAPPVPVPVAEVVTLNGSAQVRRAPAAAVMPLRRGDVIYQGDKLETAAASVLRILMHDKSVLDLGPQSVITIDTFKQEGEHTTVRLRTFLGKLWARVMPRREGSREFVVSTPNAVAGVRGTSFVVAVDNDQESHVTTVTGQVQLMPVNGGHAAPAYLEGMQTASIHGTAWPPQLGTLTSAQLQQLRVALTPHAGLDAGGAAQRVQVVTEKNAGNSAPGNTQPLHNPPTTNTTTQPPLNIDPGARLTHVHGHVQIND